MGSASCLAGVVIGALCSLLASAGLSRRCLQWHAYPKGEDDVVLGDATYRVRAIEAPAASGRLLRLLAAVLGSQGFLAQSLRRMLINDNKVVKLRSLAAQIIRGDSALALRTPLCRLGHEGREAHARLAAVPEPMVPRPGRYNSVRDYHLAFVGQRTTPLQVLEAALAAIDEQPPDLRVFASLADRGALRREAEESGRRYAAGRALSEFDGVPVAVKDMVRVAGLNCTFGTHPSFGTGPDTQDDIVVARLRQKGAIVLGLTVMTEHGTSPLGYSVHSRAPVNPYSRRHYSGGSSSGSGVGVALGLFPVSLGFDGGGSIRIPSAMCGIVGLKCTWGRVPIDGSVCCQVNVAPGPMAASAVDAALFYQVIGSAARDHYYQRLYGGAEPPPAHCSGIGRIEDLGDLRLGVFWEWFEDCQPEVLSLVREALRFLQSRGAQVVSVKIPHLEVLSLAHAVSISADFTTQHEHQAFDAPWTLEPATTIQLAIGSAWSGVEVKSADWFRAWMCDFLQRLFDEQQLSGLFMPTMACLPPELPAAARDTGESNTSLVMQLMKFIGLANFCGLPAVSMPVGLSPGGLPVGAQLVARHWDEHICLRVANALDVDQFRSVPPGHVDLLARAGAAGQASC